MNYRGIKIKTDDDVYEPCDDTFLLMDCLEGHIGKGERVLDLGAGTGILGIFCAMHGAKSVCVDINPFAVKLAQENAKSNGVEVEAIKSDMFENVKGKFDVIIFNPPYLPTEEHDKIPGALNYAFDGGKDGNDAIFHFIGEFENYLAPGGRVYILLSSLNDVEKIREKFEENEFKSKKMAERAFDFEKLFVYVITSQPSS
ncbi:MAG: class I SAM-dependent methyltransferase [Candidatus Thermoplasmatota archaeon]|nr:class I SAM-dependent methyltransferase [Candidatus Thermoplasmatota archaeon]